MKIQPKGFLCDECDGYIGIYEEYVKFQGMNFCQSCFENHKHDIDIEEEGTEYTCEMCDEPITSGYYYRFDDEYFCEECVKDHKYETSSAEEMDDYFADKGEER